MNGSIPKAAEQANIILHCYKLFTRHNLAIVAGFFHISTPDANPGYLRLDPKHLESILKDDTVGKYVWIFRDGGICLANCDISETHRFIRCLAELGLQPDFELFAAYHETYTYIHRDGISPLATHLELCAIALSKSVELKHMETRLDSILDRSESFLIDLQKGFPHPRQARFYTISFEMVRLNLQLIHTLKISDRPALCRHGLSLRKTYDSVVSEFELKNRAQILQEKFFDLFEIMTPYQKLGFHHKEQRLYFWEIILLTIFPFFYLFERALRKVLQILF